MNHIKAYRMAELAINGKSAFTDYDPEGTYPYAMYCFIIRNPEGIILVDTGPKSIPEINKGLQGLLRAPVVQQPDEDILSILAKEALKPEDIDYVIFTHLHYDHCSNFDLFPRARYVINRGGWQECLARLNPDYGKGGPWVGGDVLFPLRDECAARLMLVDDEEILPGVNTVWLGGHTPDSQAVIVETEKGKVALTGDTISLYANLETPIGVSENIEQCKQAVDKIKALADIIIPSHDPEILDRFPNGIIA